MSIRVDSSSLITGAVVVGDPGLGVLAELVPSTGEHGAGYLYASLEFPADTGKEVRGLITTWPTLGTLTAFEDSSFEYDGPTDSFAFQMYVDGVAVGTPQTVTVTVGAATSVTADATAAYTLRASVSSDAVAAYTIAAALSSVSSDAAASYTVRAAVQSDAAAAYAIRSSISADAAAAYLVRGTAQQDAASSYTVRAQVSADAAAAYAIENAGQVSANAEASYAIRGLVSADAVAAYTIRTPVSAAVYRPPRDLSLKSLLSTASVTPPVTPKITPAPDVMPNGISSASGSRSSNTTPDSLIMRMSSCVVMTASTFGTPSTQNSSLAASNFFAVQGITAT